MPRYPRIRYRDTRSLAHLKGSLPALDLKPGEAVADTLELGVK
jgi:hypothetical protein